ncbi:MAG: ThiF family adenylyltransferase [Akkermansiaceae bacterium]|nr:ThiF family adenylyltransferase [Akkermansiaceae bacterium]
MGGLGGPLAFSLAAAGVGRIILAHGGTLRPDDLNRQILMTHDGLGDLRHEQAAVTLRRFNPNIEGIMLLTNFTPAHTDHLIHIDTALMRMSKLNINRHPACPHCAGSPSNPS